MNFLELLYFFLVLKLQVVKYKVKVCLIALYSAGVADTQRKTFDRAAGRSTNPVSLSSAVVSRSFFSKKGLKSCMQACQWIFQSLFHQELRIGLRL